MKVFWAVLGCAAILSALSDVAQWSLGVDPMPYPYWRRAGDAVVDAGLFFGIRSLWR